MSRSLGRSLGLLLAGLLLLIVASPAAAYNEENVLHVRITRLDPVACATPIRLVADLRDRSAEAVPGATLDWSFMKQEAGDTLAPTTTISDSEGRARTTLTLACLKGTRIVRAQVPGGAGAITTLPCRSDESCQPDRRNDAGAGIVTPGEGEGQGGGTAASPYDGIRDLVLVLLVPAIIALVAAMVRLSRMRRLPSRPA